MFPFTSEQDQIETAFSDDNSSSTRRNRISAGSPQWWCSAGTPTGESVCGSSCAAAVRTGGQWGPDIPGRPGQKRSTMRPFEDTPSLESATNQDHSGFSCSSWTNQNDSRFSCTFLTSQNDSRFSCTFSTSQNHSGFSCFFNQSECFWVLLLFLDESKWFWVLLHILDQSEWLQPLLLPLVQSESLQPLLLLPLAALYCLLIAGVVTFILYIFLNKSEDLIFPASRTLPRTEQRYFSILVFLLGLGLSTWCEVKVDHSWGFWESDHWDTLVCLTLCQELLEKGNKHVDRWFKF